MPRLGTSQRTEANAEELVRMIGAESRIIPIHKAVEQHFKDIDHDGKLLDVAYENAQARERTQILMDLANKYGGSMVSTGGLSEAALGWCTFSGGHMSIYHVNVVCQRHWCATLLMVR